MAKKIEMTEEQKIAAKEARLALKREKIEKNLQWAAGENGFWIDEIHGDRFYTKPQTHVATNIKKDDKQKMTAVLRKAGAKKIRYITKGYREYMQIAFTY